MKKYNEQFLNRLLIFLRNVSFVYRWIRHNKFYCISDSFTFGKRIQNWTQQFIFCSFDIARLYTNVPLDETIDICVNT